MTLPNILFLLRVYELGLTGISKLDPTNTLYFYCVYMNQVIQAYLH